MLFLCLFYEISIHACPWGSVGLDGDRSRLYCDLVLNSLTENARRALLEMDAKKYEYQSEFARRYYGQGKAEGMAEILLKQLTTRYGALSAATAARIREASSTAELESIAERILTAKTLDEALGIR